MSDLIIPNRFQKEKTCTAISRRFHALKDNPFTYQEISMDQQEWQKRIRTTANRLTELSNVCPHCQPKEFAGCALCNPLWQLSEMLVSYANLIHQTTFPREIKE